MEGGETCDLIRWSGGLGYWAWCDAQAGKVAKKKKTVSLEENKTRDLFLASVSSL